MTTKPTRSILLCPTDFSANAKKAATVATALAARAGLTLVLVHAANVGSAFLVSANSRRIACRVAEAQLQEEARRLRRRGARIETVLLPEGWAPDALLKFIRENPPEFIVLSSRRMSALDRWALGSVSDQVAQHAACPTLVVRDSLPFLAWAEGHASLKVFAALDFGSCTEAALRWIGQLRRIGRCELTACHVNWMLNEHQLADAPETTLNARNSPAVQSALERDLKKQVRDVLGDDSEKIVVKATWGAPESVLIEEAEAAGADVIVVGTHQRHGLGWLWHGSVSRGLVHHAPMSVACVPTVAAVDPKYAHVPQFRRVLVTTDLSPLGNAAIPLACAAMAPGGVVEILHVTSPAVRTTKRAQNALKETLLALAPAEAGKLGLRVEVQVVANRKPADAIAREAERFGADLICIASHGRSGVSKTLLGSVTQSVMAQTHRPILVARAGG